MMAILLGGKLSSLSDIANAVFEEIFREEINRIIRLNFAHLQKAIHERRHDVLQEVLAQRQ
jgi:hypothetical protein